MTEALELHRRHTLTVKIGGDTWSDLIRSLDDLSDILGEYDTAPERSWSGVSGGPTAGYTYDVGFDPDMDHDKYFALIKARTGVG